VPLSAQTVQCIIDSAVSDPDFPAQFVQDPAGALEIRGVSLEDGELDELRSLIVRASAPRADPVEELESRMSHSLVGHGEVEAVLLIEHFVRGAAREE
jgi:hypothetical protein